LNSTIVIILIAMALLVLAVIAFLIIRRQRREVDPPIQVETAMWSKAGQLDWCVKERQKW
jgi:preprotein translocase subunit YajC